MTTPDNADMTARIEAHAKAAAQASAPGAADIPPLNPPGQTADTAPQKRGRGRPPKNKDAASVQAQINASASKGENTAKKASAKKAASAAELDVTKLGGQIQGLHIIVAKVTGMPFMMLSEKESFALAESVVNVAEQYELTVNPKVAAGIQLALTAAMIYGPRAIAFTQAKKQAINAAQMRAASGNADDVSANPAG
jgi:hypothetical protein